ncbi:AB-hydrolase YheT [Polyplosphaeria fusca]|uniref:AB-hydrolase YheT n=1 Tax=Polyplosphaeria fusca TaxID=682080 RepID=A0A9P4R4B2_9PLEO|nr:AB-hydrolase YheT [Polyplosphaeria fusca]
MALVYSTTSFAVSAFASCLAALIVSLLAFSSREHPRFEHGVSIDLCSTSSPERRKFVKICRQAIPPCKLNPFLLSSGHLHTLWNLATARRAPPCRFNRILIEQKDPRYAGSFAMDFFHGVQDGQIAPSAFGASNAQPRTSTINQEQKQKLAKNDVRPMLIILPGLGGGSEEEYIQETCQSVTEKGDWEVVVVISRACSRTILTSKLFYHAGSTWDLAQAVTWLTEMFPNRPLYALGFSLGANILANYVADEAGKCLLQAAMTVSNPWDLEKSLDALQSSWFGKETYLRALGTTLKRKALANAEQISANSGIDLDAVRRAKYLPDFDLAVQVPMWKFKSVRHYYQATSSAHRVASVAIPFLVVNALDDPISAGAAIPSNALATSAHAVLCTTKHGGHVGWHCIRGRRWIAGAASSFFDEMRNWRLKEDVNVDF